MKSYETPQQILSNLGIDELNEMQITANQSIQDENEILLLAPTGSGKTLAFLLPILSQINPYDKGIQCLILSPSRELAIQIEQVWRKMSTGYKVNVCYGGHSMPIEIQSLSDVPTLLIGTPGRISDHISRRSINLEDTKIVVYDEFDKSLSLGFEAEMSFIAQKLINVEKKILVSATAQIRIPEFVGANNITTLDYTKSIEKTNDGLLLQTVFTDSKNKLNTLFQLICHLGSESTLVFCNLRETAEIVCETLNAKGIESAFFHGKMEQIDREKTLVKFRNGSITFLVASDLAARGLDIPNVKNIIHFELPFHSADFIHRNGRTARMNAVGTAYVLIEKDKQKPPYLANLPKEFKIPKSNHLPKPSQWLTLYISGGKKDKLSKMDIVGFLSKKGQLIKDDIGLIELMDFMSFVAVKKSKVDTLLFLIQNEKMKGKKYRIKIDE